MPVLPLPSDDARNLACARIIVFVVIAWRFSTDAIVAFAELPSELIRMPIGMGWLRDVVPTDPEYVRWLAALVRSSAAAAAAGLFTRVSTWVATLSACVLFVIPNMFGHVGHDRHHLIWFAAILAASPCGDRLSLDRFLLRTWGEASASRASFSPRYGVPLRAMLVTMGVAYFFAGAWKILSAGSEWILSSNLWNLTAKVTYASLGGDGQLLLAHPSLTPFVALGVVVFELGFIVLLFVARGRAVALVGAFAFHLGTYWTLGISFGHLLYTYLAFVDWAGIWRRIRREPSPARENAMPSPWQVAVVVAVIGANLGFGLSRVGNGWPFACYPRFDVIHTPLLTSYVIAGRTEQGEVVRLHDGELGGPVLGRHFYNVFRANQARVAGLESIDGRLPRWQGLSTYMLNHDPRLSRLSSARFILDDLDVSAGPGRPRRLGERVILECDRP